MAELFVAVPVCRTRVLLIIARFDHSTPISVLILILQQHLLEPMVLRSLRWHMGRYCSLQVRIPCHSDLRHQSTSRLILTMLSQFPVEGSVISVPSLLRRSDSSLSSIALTHMSQMQSGRCSTSRSLHGTLELRMSSGLSMSFILSVQ